LVWAPILAAGPLAAVLIRDFGSQRFPGATDPPQAEQPERMQFAGHQTPSTDVEFDASHPEANEAVTHDEQRPNSPNDSRGTSRNRLERDEATARADIRKSATEEVRDSYALLLEDLTLTLEERNDLVALLIEMQIEGMWSRGSTWEIRGRNIPDQERYERIAAVIGDQKLLAFLELQQNQRAYWETTQIARLLRRRGIPLTETQRDGVFEILVEVNARYPHTSPPTDVDDDSVEWIEHVLMQYDEHDRHVIELAPSVLSQDQVVRLFAQYQSMSRERVSSVEHAKKLKVEQPDKFRGWFYSPGSWN
jgi:hypothetical protein